MQKKNYVMLNVFCALVSVLMVAYLSSTICQYCVDASNVMITQIEPSTSQNRNTVATIECESHVDESTQKPTYPQDVIVVDVMPSEPELDLQNELGLSDSDVNALKQIAMAEAEGEDIEGKALVMMVVLNRRNANGFPNTVEGVILQESSGTHQFSVTRTGGRYWKVTPDEECTEALNMILNGWDESKGALYFESCSDPDNWHSRNLEFLFQYGAHRFYK